MTDTHDPSSDPAGASPEILEAILATAVESIITIDERGRIESVNAVTEQLFGYAADELVGRNVRLLMPSPHAEAHDGYLRRYLETGEARIIGTIREVEGLRKDRTTFPAQLAVTHVAERGRTVFVGLVRDVTEYKEAERVLREAKREAEAASRAKSEFLANMSHEIRTPMNGILGMTELALDTDLSGQQRGYLEAAKKSADALLAIVNDILDFSKIEVGKLQLDPHPFGLRETLGDTLRALALRAHEQNTELAWEVAPGVPDGIVGDAARLRQVLLNLVGNAVKFTQEGEIVVAVRAASATDDQVRLTFSVRDTGVGIPADKLATIFEAFAQADTTTTRRFGGTGLGLAISSRLVQMMGGEIDVESEVGTGSTFRFTAHCEIDRTPAPQSLEAVREALRGVSVLIVDDNETNRRILVDVVRNWSMQPTAVDGGRPALEALRTAAARGAAFRLALLDYQMPEMDGLMLAEAIRADPDIPKTQLVMLTSGAGPESEERGRALGIRAQLLKPVKQSELLDAIAQALGAVRLRTQPLAEKPAEPSTRPLRVLLAEDNQVNQQLAVRLLKKRGHEVTVTEDGREAVDVFAARPNAYDLVLMDVQMPKLDGFAATAAMRELERDAPYRTPIVAMTAHAMRGDRERCLDAGMDGYVAKPIEVQELLHAIDEVTRPAAKEALARDEDESAPAAAGTEDAVLDWREAVHKVGGDEELLEELASIFLEAAPGMLTEVKDAVERGEAPSLERAAHRLKGSVGNFAATEAAEAATHLERAGAAGDLAGAAEGVEALAQALERMRAALRSRLGGSGS